MNLALIPGLGSVGPTELIILLTIILLLFGAKRIPELARGLGTGIKEFKRGTSGEADKDAVKDRKEDQELPYSEATQNDKVRAEDENASVGQAGQKH
jgi:sec-independent protein translocase protein TatA